MHIHTKNLMKEYKKVANTTSDNTVTANNHLGVQKVCMGEPQRGARLGAKGMMGDGG